jgi:hypothetical protein
LGISKVPVHEALQRLRQRALLSSNFIAVPWSAVLSPEIRAEFET